MTVTFDYQDINGAFQQYESVPLGYGEWHLIDGWTATTAQYKMSWNGEQLDAVGTLYTS